jgi:hypothetical protein
VLISSITSSPGPALFPLLLFFLFLIVAFSITFTTLFEKIPSALAYPDPPRTTSVRTNALVNDWFIGQWQWLMGFAGWTAALSLYGSAYMDIYGYAWAWWLLCIVILTGYLLSLLRIVSHGSFELVPHSPDRMAHTHSPPTRTRTRTHAPHPTACSRCG